MSSIRVANMLSIRAFMEADAAPFWHSQTCQKQPWNKNAGLEIGSKPSTVTLPDPILTSGPLAAVRILRPRLLASKASHSRETLLWLPTQRVVPVLTKFGGDLVDQEPVGMSWLIRNGYKEFVSSPRTQRHSSRGAPLITVSPATAKLKRN